MEEILKAISYVETRLKVRKGTMVEDMASLSGLAVENIPRLTKALRLAVVELDFIKTGCLVPPDGGQPKLEDAVKAADEIIAEIEKVLK
jgi:hypothetical protein